MMDALERIGEPAVKHLEEAAKSENDRIRKNAEKILKKIKDKKS